MSVILIPGVRQDHLGQDYQIGMDEHGKQLQVLISTPKILLPKVMVSSVSGLTYQSIENQSYDFQGGQERKLNNLHRLMNGSLHYDGEQYESFEFLQRRG